MPFAAELSGLRFALGFGRIATLQLRSLRVNRTPLR
jgi:hypothetical protein